MTSEQSQDFHHILLDKHSLLDVRAPVEYQQGAFPNANNAPLLNDEERQQVGLCYKNQGQQKAIELGHQLVSGVIKQQRIEYWIQQLQNHSIKYLYCYRGGLRSKISQQWLHEAGFDIPRVKGGYKAMRNFLIKQLNQADSNFSFTLVGGLTGCRKTTLVDELKQGIDLEGAAYHRGSSFGAHATAQSSQIAFEHQLAIDLMRAQKNQYDHIALEDEGRFIGSVDIPKNIFEKMRQSPMVVIERSIEQRIEQLLKEYVTDMLAEFSALNSNEEHAYTEFSNYLLNSLQRICKRLGQQRWQELDKVMRAALMAHQHNQDISLHKIWLKVLLTDYYDPMYLSQLEQRKDSIIFRGDFVACKQYITEKNQPITQG
jgi:tRNA 2-selenouridine synthase